MANWENDPIKLAKLIDKANKRIDEILESLKAKHTTKIINKRKEHITDNSKERLMGIVQTKNVEKGILISWNVITGTRQTKEGATDKIVEARSELIEV